ncbi:protein TBATA isoform X2 [Hemicordylus capensis]|uniref:protein TBATA isoform X2 n=1 Tax=Hemicordylus capensis TaxID=884348 RepID=UPI0023029607|nr:protein TBATA isoform X2 [Hemicordylus capensis]
MFLMLRKKKMTSDMKISSPHLQQIVTENTVTQDKMEKLKGPVANSFKSNNITTLAGKLKHVALNTPLRFSIQAPRSQLQSTARFGSLSHHSFFSRHNPHPHRVTHIQGLNGVPVCMVNDEWSEQTILPPHPMIKSHLCTSVLAVPGVQMPIGDPQPIPIPILSIGSLSDAWREELRELAAKVRAASSIETEKKTTTEKSRRQTQYSEETGRLIPPSSRATTRHSSRQVQRNNAKNKGKDATLSFQDQELIILELLCQILQTDSLTAIQQWLLAASQKEKNIVMGLLQIATANLHIAPQELTTSMEEKLPSQLSQNATDFASRQHGRNHPTSLSVLRQKQEPILEEEKPENLEAPSLHPGILYQYRYSLESQLNYLSKSSLNGSNLQAEALVDVHLLWRNTNDAGEQLLHVQIQDLQIQHNLDHKKSQTIHSDDPSLKTSMNTTELQQPLFLHWNNGKVEGIYGDKAGNSLMLELKRGLVSLFQFQTESGTSTEEDISGSCQVTYAVAKDSVQKTKDLHSCIRPKFGFSSVNKIFGIQWQPTSKTLYSVEGSLIKSVLSEESHIISLTLKSSVGVNITSRQHLELKSQVPGSKELLGKSLQEALATLVEKPRPVNIASDPSKRACTECPILRTYLKTLAKRKSKMNIAKASTTWHFQKVVQMLRDAKKRDIRLLLKKAPEDMVPFCIEAAVAAQSTASLMTLSEILDFGNKRQTPLLEKFLYAAAFSPRPSKELLRLVLDKLDGKKPDVAIWETGNIVIGSLVGKLCQMKLCGQEDVRRGIDTVLKRLESAKEDSEKIIFLLSLKSALLPETIPTLLRYAEEGSAAVSAAAISALQRYPTEHISSQVKMAMKRIFHQVRRSYAKISRIAAAEILMDNNPSPMDFTNILLATRKLEPEMSRFLLSKIQGIIHSHHHPTKHVIKDVLKDPQINNYDILSAQAGSSICFAGPLAVTNGTLSTFGLELLFSEFGLLRKSVADFSLQSHGHQLQAAQVTIEAKGFENILGGSAANGEDTELMVGMSAALLDVQLRPVTFFQGYTDLMSKFLSSSEEPISVVKGNVLLMDHQQAIPLQSGLQAVITLQGGLGLDVSAGIDVNLWEQEFKTSIETRGALTIDFQAEVDAPNFQATIRSQTEVEMATNFNTAARLSDMLMCLQLTEEQVIYGEVFSVSESSANNNNTARKGRWTTIPGREFLLHRANSEMCKILLAEQ